MSESDRKVLWVETTKLLGLLTERRRAYYPDYQEAKDLTKEDLYRLDYDVQEAFLALVARSHGPRAHHFEKHIGDHILKPPPSPAEELEAHMRFMAVNARKTSGREDVVRQVQEAWRLIEDAGLAKANPRPGVDVDLVDLYVLIPSNELHGHRCSWLHCDAKATRYCPGWHYATSAHHWCDEHSCTDAPHEPHLNGGLEP